MQGDRPSGLGLTLGILLVVYLFNFLDRQIINILAEPIARDLGLNDTQIGLMAGLAFALFYTVLGLPIARFADRPGSNRIWIISAAVMVWSVFTAISGLAQNFVQLLLARIGVGAGEAGCTPPAHSLITDMAPPEQRGRAMAIYQLGPPIGGLIGMALGGLLAQSLGWRNAFFLVGAPGILLALLVVLLLRDPRLADVKRNLSEKRAQSGVSTGEAFGALVVSRAMRWLLFVAGVGGVAVYGVLLWATIFFQRSHGLTLAETGVIWGIVSGLGMLAGVWFGGQVSDRHGRFDKRHVLTTPALGYIIAAPVMAGALLMPVWWISMGLFGVTIMLLMWQSAPYYRAVQGLVPPTSRAVASATVLFLQNLVGLGLGPLLVGSLSDALRPELGNDSVRYALFVICFVSLVAGAALWLSRKYLPGELDRFG